jgi:hypothetical protein
MLEFIARSFELTDSLNSEHALSLGTAAVRLEQPGQAAQVRELCEGLLEPSAYNLQVVVVLLRATVEENGVPGAARVLEGIIQLLAEHWGGLSEDAAGTLQPELAAKRQLKRAQYFDSALEQIYDWLSRTEQQRGGVALGAELRAQGVDWAALCDRVRAALENRGLRVGRLSATAELLRALSSSNVVAAASVNVVPALSGANPEASSSGDGAAGAAGPEAASGSGVSGGSLAASGASGDGSLGAEVATVTLRVSARYRELEQSLAAFQKVLEKKEFTKARLIAEDIKDRIENFDVVQHFPGLFGDYFLGIARHSRELYGSSGNVDEPQWSALRRLYQTDPARFLAAEEPHARRPGDQRS